MRCKTECTLLVLDAEKFQKEATRSCSQAEFPKTYAEGYVKHLNNIPESQQTDLVDAEMDVEWLAARALNHKEIKEKQRRGSIMPANPFGSLSGHDTGRKSFFSMIHKFVRTASRSSVCSVSSSASRGSETDGDPGTSKMFVPEEIANPNEHMRTTRYDTSKDESAEA